MKHIMYLLRANGVNGFCLRVLLSHSSGSLSLNLEYILDFLPSFPNTCLGNVKQGGVQGDVCIGECISMAAAAFWHELTVIRVTKWPAQLSATGCFRLLPRGRFTHVDVFLQLPSPGATIISSVYGACSVYKKAVAVRTDVLLPFYGNRYPPWWNPKTRNETERWAVRWLEAGDRGIESR